MWHYLINVCVHVCVRVRAFWVKNVHMGVIHTPVKVKGQLTEVRSLLPCGAWRSDLGHRAWQPVPSMSQMSHWLDEVSVFPQPILPPSCCLMDGTVFILDFFSVSALTICLLLCTLHIAYPYLGEFLKLFLFISGKLFVSNYSSSAAEGIVRYLQAHPPQCFLTLYITFGCFWSTSLRRKL